MDQRLIERARLGDRAAQQALWRRHRRWVAAIILAHRPRAVEVEDLMQDVAVRLISRIESLRDPDAFRPWLRQIVINVCRGAARSLKPALRLVGSDRDADSTESSGALTPTSREEPVGQVADRREAARRLLKLALTLPSEYREPLLLRCLRSMTYRQISEVLDLPITTIETRLARARRMLREEFGSNTATEGLA
ncbi:MAG: sigma-70 family RNA polymerase sigma factor [Phycisphaerales bacterium]|nr:MAG: sigma-70 family RNA polymerase sigma factor [Phycisphaerales bacterium]